MVLTTGSATPVAPLRRRRPLIRLLVVALVFLALASVAWRLGSSAGTATTGVFNAVGAESEYANVISQIGGRYVHVSAVMSNPATDPHTYEASTGVAQAVAAARLIVQNGIGYDAFMTQLESASPNSGRKVIVVQNLLGLPSSTRNPHLWYKPSAMPIVAAKIEADLAALAPRHANYFAQRLAAFRTSMDSVTQAIATFRAKFTGVKVATTEPVADYLLAALGLNNVTPFRFQADIMNGVDPSPEDISIQQNLFTHRRVRLFLFNAQVSSTVTIALRTLAEQSRVPVVAVYETMPVPGYDFQSWMLAEISAMTKALNTGTSTKSLQ